jgi:sterol desaturase/sphingolipid hydroxylase (fatty acid hydroxylase superfamily)
MAQGFSWLTPGVVVATLAVLTILEQWCPLRDAVEPRSRHLSRNLVLTTLGFPIVGLFQAPVLAGLLRWAEQHGVGLLRLVEVPSWLAIAASVLLLDYTLWHWHWLTHRVSWLWRFHLVHHVDRDLDASTALRFHTGELVLSIPYRAMQIVVLGVHPGGYLLWQLLLFLSILFHHSNVRLPVGLERRLVMLIVTPRMHGIHHSDWENETNSNWSSLLSVWDYLHGTARLNVPQSAVRIGVPAYQRAAAVTLGKVLRLPFQRRRADWLNADGAIRRRHYSANRLWLSD